MINWDHTSKLLHDLFPMPAPRLAKCRTLHSLASKVRSGVIVELGTYHGNGAISLAMGSRSRVYTVDEYVARKGWAGEKYDPDDITVFWFNIFEMEEAYPSTTDRVILVCDSAINAADLVGESVELLYWDLGCMDVMLDSVMAWEYRVMPGGTIALHDTIPPRLGVEKTLEHLDGIGYTVSEEILGGGIWTARK